MKKVMNFFKSPMGKTILIVLVVGILAYIAYKQYETRVIFNGTSRSDVVSKIAKQYADARIAKIKTTDGNYLAGTPLKDILAWYDKNALPNISETQLKGYLAAMGVDYEKYPSALNIKADVDSESMLLKYA